MKELKDYLHLYLGCQFVMKINGTERLTAQMNFGADALNASLDSKEPITPILILRPLSDMTQDEADVIWGILDWNERITGVARITDIIREFDVIEEDNDTTSNAHWGYLCKILPYLLKYGFDLFGLIDAGLAIDKTTLKHPVPDEAPKEWEEQATKDYENGYESETSAIDKFMVADEAGEVYVWETKNPEQDLFRHPIINLTEKCHDLGWFDTKRGYWVDENGDSLGQCEWLRLSPAPPSGEDAGKGWISVEDRLPTEKDADENGKVLVYRNTNEGQKGLSKSIFDYFMVKNCDSDTVWQPLPPKP